MSKINIPSVDSLVGRIKQRINKRESVQIKGIDCYIQANSRYHLPVKNLQDNQIADRPVLQWSDQQQNINNFHSYQNHYNQQSTHHNKTNSYQNHDHIQQNYINPNRSQPFYHNYPFNTNLNYKQTYFQSQNQQNQDTTNQNRMKRCHSQKQTIRNLIYCDTEKDIPRVPHRKHQGDLMKKLIYQANYAHKPRVKPTPVNYDVEYTKHQKKYYEIPVRQQYGNKYKSRSKIRPVVQRDRLSGKKYMKFSNMQ